VGSIHGGTRANIIPDEVKMELTVRYYSDEVIDKVISAIRRISRTAALMSGMPEDQLPYVETGSAETPPVINDTLLTKRLEQIISETIGEENLLTLKPAMVGEDFGKYGRTQERVPLALIWLGSTSPELMKELKVLGKIPEPLHSSQLMPDYKNTIRTGIRVMTANVLGLMQTHP
jgi:hippurate hydrolase